MILQLTFNLEIFLLYSSSPFFFFPLPLLTASIFAPESLVRFMRVPLKAHFPHLPSFEGILTS